MSATDRIAEEFERLLTMGQDRIPDLCYPERVVYFVVAVRCEIDMEGFESVFEQAFKPSELKILIDGLRSLEEPTLADEFASCLDLLQNETFYDHLNWHMVSEDTKHHIRETGKRIGEEMWGLDEKLASLLDSGVGA